MYRERERESELCMHIETGGTVLTYMYVHSKALVYTSDTNMSCMYMTRFPLN